MVLSITRRSVIVLIVSSKKFTDEELVALVLENHDSDDDVDSLYGFSSVESSSDSSFESEVNLETPAPDPISGGSSDEVNIETPGGSREPSGPSSGESLVNPPENISVTRKRAPTRNRIVNSPDKCFEPINFDKITLPSSDKNYVMKINKGVNDKNQIKTL